VDIDLFEMERMQSLYFHEVDFDLSESGVLPLTIAELLGDDAGADELLATKLAYPLSEGSALTRERIAAWYPGATTDNVTVVNGGSEANHLTLWALLEPGDRLAFMVPNYMQGWGLGRHYGDGTDVFHLMPSGDRWALDVGELDRRVTERTKAVMVCNPNNPTGHVMTEDEMSAVVDIARRANAWLVVDEVYRGAEVGSDETSPSFWGRYDRTVVTAGLSKAFGLPGLRIGWTISPPELAREIRLRHDYTTLTPGMVSDRLAAVAMEPEKREWILGRTRAILSGQWPRLEEWLRGHGDVFSFVPPKAGAIVYAEYDLPIDSKALVDRIREEKSVLLVPGDMLGLGHGLRFGYGYDIERTLEGLARVDEVLADIGS
jgi:aspartate/methionine/tyrosine aminotransferase